MGSTADSTADNESADAATTPTSGEREGTRARNNNNNTQNNNGDAGRVNHSNSGATAGFGAGSAGNAARQHHQSRHRRRTNTVTPPPGEDSASAEDEAQGEDEDEAQGEAGDEAQREDEDAAQGEGTTSTRTPHPGLGATLEVRQREANRIRHHARKPRSMQNPVALNINRKMRTTFHQCLKKTAEFVDHNNKIASSTSRGFRLVLVAINELNYTKRSGGFKGAGQQLRDEKEFFVVAGSKDDAGKVLLELSERIVKHNRVDGYIKHEFYADELEGGLALPAVKHYIKSFREPRSNPSTTPVDEFAGVAPGQGGTNQS